MRSKLLKLFWLNLGLLSLSTAHAAVTIVPYNVPNAVVDNGDGFASVYYLDVTYGGQGAPTYSTHDFEGGEVFNFTIGGAEPAKGYLWVYAQSDTDSTTYYPIQLASCTAGAVGTIGRCDSGAYTDFQIGINLKSVCTGVNGTLIRGCVGTSVGLAALPIKAFRIRVLTGTSTAPTNDTRATGTLIQINPEVTGPDLTTAITAPGFFPGDSAILVETNELSAEPDSATASAPIVSTWIVAEKGGSITIGSEMSATLRQTIPYHSGQQEISGFENSNDTTQVFYEMSAGVQDSAGAITFPATAFTNVFATDIQGFLRESNCFIATASFRDGRASGVMLLREFRDEVLSEFSYGRDFIRWYYAYGPLAAKWLLAHPIFRSFFLMLLLPLEAAAWILLHPALLLIPLLSLVFGFFLFGFFRRRPERRHV